MKRGLSVEPSMPGSVRVSVPSPMRTVKRAYRRSRSGEMGNSSDRERRPRLSAGLSRIDGIFNPPGTGDRVA